MALYAAALDARVRVCAANRAIGSGERRLRFQYRDEAACKKFLRHLEEARRVRRESGRATMIGRVDIVAIPEHRRGAMPTGTITESSAETAISMRDWLARCLPAPAD